MSFRTVIITSPAKLSLKDNCLFIRGDKNKLVNLSEIHTLIIESQKEELINILNKEIKFNGKKMYLVNAIPIFISKCLTFLENGKNKEICYYEYGV